MINNEFYNFMKLKYESEIQLIKVKVLSLLDTEHNSNYDDKINQVDELLQELSNIRKKLNSLNEINNGNILN